MVGIAVFLLVGNDDSLSWSQLKGDYYWINKSPLRFKISQAQETTEVTDLATDFEKLDIDTTISEFITVRETTEATTTTPTSTTSSSTTASSTSTETEKWKEPREEFTYPLRDKSRKLCLLAKFNAVFTIQYKIRGGNQSVATDLPKHPIVEGECENDSQKKPTLQIIWSEFRFFLNFSKLSEPDDDDVQYWGVEALELTYDTRTLLFDGAVNGAQMTARSNFDGEIWKTPLGRSYYCPDPKEIPLYNNKKVKKVTVKLKDLRIQPYNLNSQFSEAYECSEIIKEDKPEIEFRDETVPIAVGSTFAILTLIGVSGYAIYRTITARRVDYSTME